MNSLGISLENGRDGILNISSIFPEHFLLQLPDWAKVILVTTLVLSGLVVIVAKSTIFKSILSYSFVTRPTNLLLLVDQLFDTWRRSSILWLSVLLLVTNKPLANLLGGQLFCKAWRLSFFITNGYVIFGSFGITVLRTIYIRGAQKIRMSEGAWFAFACLLLFLSIVMSVMIGLVFYNLNLKESYAEDLCNGYGPEYMQILMEYKTAINPMEQQNTTSSLWYSLVMSIHLFEASLYAMLVHHLYLHNKTMVPLIGPLEVQKRNRKTAISFTCEMYGYFMENVMIVLLILTTNSGLGRNGRNLVVFAWNYEYPIKSVIQACSTHSTRQIFIGALESINVARHLRRLRDPAN